MTINHNYYLDLAFKQAEINLGKTKLNPSVGSVLVQNNSVISSGYTSINGRPHAEANALKNNLDYKNSDLYVTLEPCLMCFGACIHARINNLIYASDDPKSGVITSNLNLADETFLNHKISITKGVLSEESSQLLKDFFKERRVKN